MLSEMGIQVVESEESEEGEAIAAKPLEAEDEEATEQTGNINAETAGRTDDPVRMYLREMGSVELLSREGEIAIAKRIEAGRDMMIGGLCESPLTFRAIVAWHEALKTGKILLRDVIDLEATQGMGNTPAEGESDEPDPSPPAFDAVDDSDEEEGEGSSLSLSALEEKLKPEVLATFDEIEALYKKLHKVQHKRLESMTSGEEMNLRSEKSYAKQREELVAKVRQVRLHNNRIEELVAQFKQLNQRLTALEGQLLRLAESCKVPRDEFLKEYRGSELDPNWIERMSGLNGKGWKLFVAKHGEQIGELRSQIGAIANDASLPIEEFRRVYMTVSRGERDSARAKKEMIEANLPPRDFDREEVHQPRIAVSGPHPGRQYRPDEGGRQIRVPARLQVQHLCHLVDPPGDYPLDRRPGPHDPHPGAHDRDDQQARPHLAADAA